MTTTTDAIQILQPTAQDLQNLGTSTWPIWACDVSTFDWHYDEKETCHILEGEVTVRTADQEVHFGKGDLVIFPAGLDCTWSVTRPVKKHYKFGD